MNDILILNMSLHVSQHITLLKETVMNIFIYEIPRNKNCSVTASRTEGWRLCDM